MRYGLKDQKKAGAIGERIFCRYLRSIGITDIVDVREDLVYQKRGIDYLVRSKKGKEQVGVDVKTDTFWPVKNFFLEYKTINPELHETSSAGCFISSEAKYWFYYFINSDLAYWINLVEARKYMDINGSGYIWATAETQNYDGDIFEPGGTTFEAVGRIVPVDHLLGTRAVNIPNALRVIEEGGK